MDLINDLTELTITEAFADLENETAATIDCAKQIGDMLEAVQQQDAYRLLPDLLDRIRLLYDVTSQDLGWVEPADATIRRAQMPDVLERALSLLISAQESHSWLLLADVIKYEVQPILVAWQTLIRTTRELR